MRSPLFPIGSRAKWVVIGFWAAVAALIIGFGLPAKFEEAQNAVMDASVEQRSPDGAAAIVVARVRATGESEVLTGRWRSSATGSTC